VRKSILCQAVQGEFVRLFKSRQCCKSIKEAQLPQHFLHSATARDFSIFDATDLDSHQAHAFLASIRWGADATQTCPSCGTIDKHYFQAGRKQWRCKHCGAYFSITTGTVLQDRKLPHRKIIVAVFLFITSANGISALELARSLKISVKTAFVLLSKIREVIVRSADLSNVQMDGAHFCAKPRKPNRRTKITAEQVIARLSAKKGSRSKAAAPRTRMSKASVERLKNRRVILVARQTSTTPGDGATRSIVGVALHENEAAVHGFAQRAIIKGSTLWTDENPAYNGLGSTVTHAAVNHSAEFVSENGVNDNQCESFNSRIRRAEYGVFHGFRPKYLGDYLWEFAWRDDGRRTSMRTKLMLLLSLILTSERSIWWRGYWQGAHRSGELLFKFGHRTDFVNPGDPRIQARTTFPPAKSGPKNA
jgi:transposase-like protein